MSSIGEIGYYFFISLLAISLIIMCLYLIFSSRKKPVESEETLPVKAPAQAYPLTEIDAATDGFNSRRVIGRGRLGTVYAGVLRGEELVVAVKRIHPSLVLTKAGFGFSSILKTLSLACHPNVVSILGFSQAPGERIIVMELVGSVSLDYYLHENDDEASLLDWSRRLRIAAGAARGLEYLHDKLVPNVVHGCVKTSNVLLDARFCPKFCDYGLSFLGPGEVRRGLIGYVDDEYWVGEGQVVGNGACKESDVFGFGVVLLELLTGRRAGEGLLVRWALPIIRERRFREVLDPRLLMPSDLRPIVRFAKVASSCVSNSRKSRPTIAQVASILNNLEAQACA